MAEGSVLDRWESFLVAGRGMRPSAARKYRQSVELADVSVEQFTFEVLEERVKRLVVRRLSSSTRRLAVVALRRFGEYLVQSGRIPANPALALRPPKAYSPESAVFAIEEIERLVLGTTPGVISGDALDLRDRSLIGAAYITGLRRFEAAKVRREDVRWEPRERVFSILIREGKAATQDVRRPLSTAMSRLLGLHLEMRDDVDAWRSVMRGSGGISPAEARRIVDSAPLWPSIRGSELSVDSVAAVLAGRMKTTGLAKKGRSFHSLRHSIATHLLESGVPVDKVQKFMRHGSITTTMRYLHTARAGRWVSRLNRLGKEPPRAGVFEALGEVVSGVLGG